MENALQDLKDRVILRLSGQMPLWQWTVQIYAPVLSGFLN